MLFVFLDENYTSSSYNLKARGKMRDEDIINHLKRALINDRRILMGETSASLTHILRGANRCMDKLARLGARQGEQFVQILIPPDELITDMQGSAFPSGF